MGKETRGYMDDMGETDAGIRSADDIDTNFDNKITTLWDKIKDRAPWFFDMRDLIAQRPNLVPTGVGHSDSAFDVDVIGAAPGPLLDAPASEAGSPPWVEDEGPDGADPGGFLRSLAEIDAVLESDSEMVAEHGPNVGSDADYTPAASDGVVDGDDALEADDEDDMSKKPKKAEGKKRTAAKAGTSLPTPLPAAPTLPSAVKKSKITEFADIAKGEEVTRQKELDLASIRVSQSLKVLELKGRLGEQRQERRKEERMARRKERALKLKMKDRAAQRHHELQMASLPIASGSRSHAANTFPSYDMDFTDGFASTSSRASSSNGAGTGNADLSSFPDYPAYNSF
ncbi:hypothetical protein B0H10DRAFT_2128838 [Mycena sp. CBHHK59/15]|nr:hypothetical protein B0H10DRAFT_2128838 [Mycena sp. CBHHK59/15]